MSLPSIGPLELIIILAIALLIVGPKRLPEMGNAVGRTIREFRKATNEVVDGSSLQADAGPVSAPAVPAAAPPPVATTAQPSTHGTEATGTDRDASDDATRPA